VSLAAVLLTGLGAAVFGSHVVDGGFVSDDWSRAAEYHYADPPRILTHALDTSSQEAGARPFLAISLSTSSALFGLRTELHLGFTLAVAVSVSIAVFLVLRGAGMAPLDAGGVAALNLLFPWSDANRFWATDGVHHISVLLFLLGALAALHSFRASGSRAQTLSVTASVLYILSVLTYEAAIPVLLASPLLYLWCAPREAALHRWRTDAVIAMGALLVVAFTTERDPGSIEYLTEATVQHVRESVALLGMSVFPLGAHAAVSLLALVALMAAFLFAWRRLPPDSERHREVRSWLLLAASAGLFIAAAYTIFLGSGLTPLAKGQDNRGNILAGVGWVTLVYAVVMATATVFTAHLRRRVGLPLRALGTLAIALVATGYLVQIEADKERWWRASELSRRVLQSIRHSVPHPPKGATIYTFGHPAQFSPGVSVFSATWDLEGALRLTYDDPTLRGYPVYLGTQFWCGARGVYPRSSPPEYDIGTGGYGRAQGASYGKAIFVDVATGRAWTVRNHHQCVVGRTRFRPGPFVLHET
jgi:hypothetical protein